MSETGSSSRSAVPPWFTSFLRWALADVAIVAAVLWWLSTAIMQSVQTKADEKIAAFERESKALVDKAERDMQQRAEEIANRYNQSFLQMLTRHATSIGMADERVRMIQEKLPALETLTTKFLDKLDNADPQSFTDALNAVMEAEKKSPDESFVKIVSRVSTLERGQFKINGEDVHVDLDQLVKLQKALYVVEGEKRGLTLIVPRALVGELGVTGELGVREYVKVQNGLLFQTTDNAVHEWFMGNFGDVLQQPLKGLPPLRPRKP